MAIAQPDSTLKSSPIQMATGLRSNGKIYVVVAVLVIILTGLFFYLIRLDKKITGLEQLVNNNEYLVIENKNDTRQTP